MNTTTKILIDELIEQGHPEKVEQCERHGQSTEYFIDGYINGEKKYEAIGSYTVAGNELEEIRDVERV